MHEPNRPSALDRAQAFGVDLATLRETLRLTPTERLQRHQRALDLVLALRAARRPDDPNPPRPTGGG